MAFIFYEDRGQGLDADLLAFLKGDGDVHP